MLILQRKVGLGTGNRSINYDTNTMEEEANVGTAFGSVTAGTWEHSTTSSTTFMCRDRSANYTFDNTKTYEWEMSFNLTTHSGVSRARIHIGNFFTIHKIDNSYIGAGEGDSNGSTSHSWVGAHVINIVYNAATKAYTVKDGGTQIFTGVCESDPFSNNTEQPLFRCSQFRNLTLSIDYITMTVS